MTEEAFASIVKTVITSPKNLDSHVRIDDSLHNNQARWSFPEGKLYVSRAAKTLLLDAETFRAAMDGLAITWDKQDRIWRDCWQTKSCSEFKNNGSRVFTNTDQHVPLTT